MYNSNQVSGEQFSFTCVQVYFDKLLTSHYSNREKYISFGWAPFNHLSLGSKNPSFPFPGCSPLPMMHPEISQRVRNPGRLLLSPCPSFWTETGLRALVRNAKTGLSAQPSCQPQWPVGFQGWLLTQLLSSLRGLLSKQSRYFPESSLTSNTQPHPS